MRQKESLEVIPSVGKKDKIRLFQLMPGLPSLKQGSLLLRKELIIKRTLSVHTQGAQKETMSNGVKTQGHHGSAGLSNYDDKLVLLIFY